MSPTHSVTVVTCHRDPPTLLATIASLATAGWPDAALSIDLFARGPWPNWFSALNRSLAHFPSADWHAIFEDDIEVTPGLRNYLDANYSTLHRDAVLSLYCAAPNHRIEPGWHAIRTPLRAYGALAYLLSPSIARRIVADCPTAPPPNHCATDHILGRWCQSASVDYLCHSPSLVRHASQVSAVREAGVPEFRQCRKFARSVSEIS